MDTIANILGNGMDSGRKRHVTNNKRDGATSGWPFQIFLDLYPVKLHPERRFRNLGQSLNPDS
jgi:hypothetical protein